MAVMLHSNKSEEYETLFTTYIGYIGNVNADYVDILCEGDVRSLTIWR